MSRYRRLVVVISLAVTAYAGYQIWAAVTAGHKIPASLGPAIGRNERVNVEVVLPFAPEQFHLTYFQRLGNVTGVRDNRIRIMQVEATQVRYIARLYWVERIDPVE